MILSILSNVGRGEHRVPVIPGDVATLRAAGFEVLLEVGAGAGAGYPDTAFVDAGARVVYGRLEALARADIVLAAERPAPAELASLSRGACLMGLINRYAVGSSWLRAAQGAGVKVLALEEVPDADGCLLLRRRLAQIAGALCPTIAGGLLLSGAGHGYGSLLSSIAGFPSAEVVIVGAGSLGRAAAQGFAGLGAQVTVLDRDLGALELAEALHGRVNTRLSSPATLAQAVRFADVLVLAAALPGQPSPHILSRADVATMHPGAVLMDLAIDQGGNAATSRPIFDPRDVYVEEGVIHFTMPNLPSLVARTSSKVFSATVTPWLVGLAQGDGRVRQLLDRAVVETDPAALG